MKVTLKGETEKGKEYPFIGVTNNEKLIVIFSEEGIGIVIGGSDYGLGHLSDDWSMNNFKPFKGTVTLEN